MHRQVGLAAIRHLDLAALCMHIADRYAGRSSAVGGEAFALVAERLIEAEVSPGGPYKDATGVPSVAVNAAVGLLFARLGQPLPKVAAFLAAASKKRLDPAARRVLAAYHAACRAQRPGVLPAPRPLPVPYRLASAQLRRVPEPLAGQANQFLARVAAADVTGEIAFIARYTASALGVTPPRLLLDRLGEANVHTWIAYMLYDHIIDGETGTAMIPVANVAMRLSFARYRQAVPHEHRLQPLIARHFDEVDAANAWELQQCRFRVDSRRLHVQELPDYANYEQLYRRSGLHMLGALIVADAAGCGPHTTLQLTAGLQHYLIARQLSDDIHDWKKDLAAGHISAVVAYLLRANHITPGTYNVAKLAVRVQRDFLHRSMPCLTALIDHHVQQARTCLRRAGCRPGKLLGLVARLAGMSRASRAEQERLVAFGRAYAGPESSAA